MTETANHNQKKEHKKMIVWFLVALLLALLPWFILAREQRPDKTAKKETKQKASKECVQMCPVVHL